jgi:hypothetical protein
MTAGLLHAHVRVYLTASQPLLLPDAKTGSRHKATTSVQGVCHTS